MGGKNIREDEMSRRSRERRRRSRSRSRSRTPRRHSPRRDRHRQKNENTGPNPYFVARRDERNKIIETSRLECCGKSPRPITDDSDDEKSNLIVKRGMIRTLWIYHLNDYKCDFRKICIKRP